jgi:DNA-binding MarR family transcriptional regulator
MSLLIICPLMSEPLGFLLSDIGRLMRRRFDERARTIGATRPQWRTLTMLSRHEGLNQGALAELLEVEPITLCRMVDRLEEAGLVERRRDPADRRAWRIYLTAKARPLLDELRRLGAEIFEQAMTGLDQPERELLNHSLETIRTNLSLKAPSSEAANG